MSQENVDLVGAVLEAFNRRDKDRLIALLDPRIEWELAGFLLDQDRSRTGPEQVWEYLTFLDSEFDDIRLELGDYIEAGEQVVVPVRWRGVGKSSGVEGEFAFTAVFTVAGGKVVRARNYPTTADALAALGVRDGEESRRP
jgi:ketosteroid isomerase-like protein